MQLSCMFYRLKTMSYVIERVKILQIQYRYVYYEVTLERTHHQAHRTDGNLNFKLLYIPAH